MWRPRSKWTVCALLLVTAFSFRFYIARFFPNDNPQDGRDYAQMARNLLEHHVFTLAAEPPYEPTLIRLPGYPIFLAGIYSVFGHGNNPAARITQALIDTASCSLVALLAFYWEPDAKRKRVAAIIALTLAAVCPFTTIYVATILTEVPAIFFVLALCLLTTFAFEASSFKRSLWWWSATGLLAGIAVFFRPDSGLFAAAVGLTLVVTLFRPRENTEASWMKMLRRRLPGVFAQGAVLSIAFLLALAPWTIRNWRVFHKFQPLAPTHAATLGDIDARGYQAWLRTWVDDQRYILPAIWSLGDQHITLDNLPDKAFDSPEEKVRVGHLLNLYNHPPREKSESEETAPATNQDEPANQSDREHRQPSEQAGSSDESDSEEHPNVEMTQEIDDGFAQIARERTARAPLRCYLWVPFKRAVNLWFDTHSEYYPFEGELFPWSDLDDSIHQQYWLPLFAGLVWIYTLLGVAGGWCLWRSRDVATRRWLLLIALLIIPRIAFFSTIENPEARYMVEIFPFLAVLGGIALARLRHVRTS
jgi:hypothetical protein